MTLYRWNDHGGLERAFYRHFVSDCRWHQVLVQIYVESTWSLAELRTRSRRRSRLMARKAMLMGPSLMSLSTLTAPPTLHPLPPFLHALILHPLMSVSVINVISLKIRWLPPVLVLYRSFFSLQWCCPHFLPLKVSASYLSCSHFLRLLVFFYLQTNTAKGEQY